MEISTLVLLLAFQVKHLIADYYLQKEYMYMNKGKKEGWFVPLYDHAAVHALGTAFIVPMYLSLNYEFLGTFYIVLVSAGLALFDMATHFAIDRWKATQGVGPDTTKFWTDLGIDQMLHHIVGILIIWWIV